MTSFAVDERLAADTLPIGDGPLSRVLMMKDARFPWLVLVPRRARLVDWVDLAAGEVSVLDGEIRAAAAALRALQPFDKLNVASLGNMVRQLHVHVVARRIGDAAWPKPVFGHGAPAAFDGGEAERRVAFIRREMGLNA
jgi:diadenosine tetraphosphate (Ap4A) HIT family hydrolase